MGTQSQRRRNAGAVHRPGLPLDIRQRSGKLRHLEFVVDARTEVLRVVPGRRVDLESWMATAGATLEDQEVVAVRVGGDERQLEMSRHCEAAERDVSRAVQVRVGVLMALELQLAIDIAGI